MKFWTVQKRYIVEDYILKGTDYIPNFVHSGFLKENISLSLPYYLILNSYNQHHNTQYPGLIFSFFKLLINDGVPEIKGFSDYEDFKSWIIEHKYAISSLWNRFSEDDYVILELNYDERFTPLFIDINDFQLIMPPISLLPPYTEIDIQRICRSLSDGILYTPTYPSYIAQGHSPYIKRENIVGIYDMFDI